MTDDQIPAAMTVESVVHSYTQAELALTEIAGAVAQFRSATEQLSAAQSQNADAVQALRAATTGSLEVAKRLDGVIRELGNVANALQSIDPDRLWSHLEAEAAQQRTEAARLRWIGISSLVAVIAVVAALALLLLLAFGLLPPA